MWGALFVIVLGGLAGCSSNDSSLSGGGAGGSPATSSGLGSSSGPGNSNSDMQTGPTGGSGGGADAGTDSGLPSNPRGSVDAGPGGGGTLDGGGTYSVTWDQACWYTYQGHEYQAMSFTQKSQPERHWRYATVGRVDVLVHPSPGSEPHVGRLVDRQSEVGVHRLHEGAELQLIGHSPPRGGLSE